MTLFPSRDVLQALQFSPHTALIRPWTFVSYMFVHANLLHLLGNMLMLFVFGTAVESRMGSRNFLMYYLFCGWGPRSFPPAGRSHAGGRVRRRVGRRAGRGGCVCQLLA